MPGADAILPAMVRQRSVRGTVLALAGCVLVGACGGSSTPSGMASTAASAIASPEPATAIPPTASPSSPDASVAVTVDLRAVGTTPRGSLVTVHSFGPSDRSPEAPAGSSWYEADLEWCLPPTLVNPVTVGNLRYELALQLSDDTTIEPEANADGSDEVYASEGSFRAGECVRGALVFAVPTGATPAFLLLVGPNGGMRWRLS
jgi:hypothetical protein